MSYSVSYRNRWWHRRRYACGYVQWDEAWRTWIGLNRRGYRRVRLERSTGREPRDG